MREIKNLDIEQSIAENRLIYKESGFDRFNRLMSYVLFSPFILIPLYLYLSKGFTFPNDTCLLHIALPVSILIGLYIIYRIVNEKKLVKIDTTLSRKGARQLLLNYAEKKGYEIYRHSNDCLILNEDNSIFRSQYKITSVIFIQNNNVMFAMISDGYRFNIPILFSHLIFRKDLNRLLNKNQQ